jgi:hypothetical protein
MYVVRLKSNDSIFNLRAYTSRTLARSSFEAGRNQVIDDGLQESALFVVPSANDSMTAIRLVPGGRAARLRIYPPPMTQLQAAAWLADLDL